MGRGLAPVKQREGGWCVCSQLFRVRVCFAPSRLERTETRRSMLKVMPSCTVTLASPTSSSTKAKIHMHSRHGCSFVYVPFSWRISRRCAMWRKVFS